MDIPTYIICLEKSRTKRCDPTFRAWSQVMSQVQRIKAITPTDFKLEDVAHPYAQSCIKLNERKTVEFIGSKVEVACALSHYKAWQTIVDSQKPGIVVEDDMAMSKSKIQGMVNQLKNMPQDTEMYLLHFNGINLRYEKLFNGYIDVQRFTGALAYYLTVQAAQKLLKHSLPVVFQVDTYAARAGLRVRSRKENKMSWTKFLRDNLGTTLGNQHISSSMLALGIGIIVVLVLLIVLICVWIASGIRQKRSLERCAAKTATLVRWEKNHAR